jgi:hypothetical protein
MIRSLYIAQSGLDAQQFNVDVNRTTWPTCPPLVQWQRPVFQTCSTRPCDSRRAILATHAIPHGSATGNGCGADGHRAHLHPGQPPAGGWGAERRDRRARILPDPLAQRQHRLHARRRVPTRQPGTDHYLAGVYAAANHHDSGRRAHHYYRRRRHGDGHAADQLAADSRSAISSC